MASASIPNAHPLFRKPFPKVLHVHTLDSSAEAAESSSSSGAGDGESLSRAAPAGGAVGHSHEDRPGTRGTALELGTANAVPLTLVAAGSAGSVATAAGAVAAARGGRGSGGRGGRHRASSTLGHGDERGRRSAVNDGCGSAVGDGCGSAVGDGCGSAVGNGCGSAVRRLRYGDEDAARTTVK